MYCLSSRNFGSYLAAFRCIDAQLEILGSSLVALELDVLTLNLKYWKVI